MKEEVRVIVTQAKVSKWDFYVSAEYPLIEGKPVMRIEQEIIEALEKIGFIHPKINFLTEKKTGE